MNTFNRHCLFVCTCALMRACVCACVCVCLNASQLCVPPCLPIAQLSWALLQRLWRSITGSLSYCRGTLCSTRYSCTHGLFLSDSPSSRTMAQQTPVDPTKMGEGRAIAVLTSGGDAQGEWKICRVVVGGGGFRTWAEHLEGVMCHKSVLKSITYSGHQTLDVSCNVSDWQTSSVSNAVLV